MKQGSRLRDLDDYRDEMRLEIARNVDQLNKLLQNMADNVDENSPPSVRYICDPSDPMKCAVVDSNGNVLRTLSNEAVLRKIKTFESKMRLRRYRICDEQEPHTGNISSETSCGSLLSQVRQVNSSTVALINKLKEQVRSLS